MKRTCKKIEEPLFFFIDGALDPAQESSRIEEHLRQCSHCRKRARAITILNKILSSLPRKDYRFDWVNEGSSIPSLFNLQRKIPDPGLEAQILQAIRTAKEERVSARKPARVHLIYRVQTAAAALLILSAAFFGISSLENKPVFSGPISVEVAVDFSLYSLRLKGAPKVILFDSTGRGTMSGLKGMDILFESPSPEENPGAAQGGGG